VDESIVQEKQLYQEKLSNFRKLPSTADAIDDFNA